jgi:hypothetical protein
MRTRATQDQPKRESLMTIDTNALLAAHAELIAQRATAATAGVAAGITRKIGAIELQMVLDGIEYTPYQAQGSSDSLTDKSVDELKVMLSDAINDRETVTTGGKRAQATLRIRRLEDALIARGVKLTPYAPQTGSSKIIPDAELLHRIAAIQKLLSRGDAVRPRIVKVATTELASLTTIATARGLTVPTTPVAAPAPSSAAMLDKISQTVQTDTQALSALDATPRKSSRKVAA